MEANLFTALIAKVSEIESQSYKTTWGRRFFRRLKGRPDIHIDIASEESLTTSDTYKQVKRLIPGNVDIQTLILICQRNIKKYETAGQFYTDIRLMIFLGITLLTASIKFAGVFESGSGLNPDYGIMSFMLLGTFFAMLFLVIKSNDSVGRSYSEILLMYLNRVKLERDLCEAKSADQ